MAQCRGASLAPAPVFLATLEHTVEIPLSTPRYSVDCAVPIAR